MDNVDEIKALRAILNRLFEADEVSVSDDAATATPNLPGQDAQDSADTPADAPGQTDQPDQATDDADIENVMTTPKDDTEGDDVNADTIALDLGVEDPGAFTVAFDNLKAGNSLSNRDQSQLVVAFSSLLTTDASTAQRAINRLRTIYKLPNQ